MTNPPLPKSQATRTQWLADANHFQCSGRYLRWMISTDRPDLGAHVSLKTSGPRPTSESAGSRGSSPVEVDSEVDSSVIGGLVGQAAAGDSHPWTIAGLQGLPQTPYRCSDHVIRDQDLWLRFDEIAQHPIEFSLVFRATPAETTDSNRLDSWDELECILSMQTSSLDAMPYQSIRSQFPAANAELIAWSPALLATAEGSETSLLSLPITGPAAAVVRHSGGCHLLAGFPGDWQSVTMLGDATQLVVQSHLQVERMEKGVIRRLRCLSAFRPAATSEQILDKVRQFQSSKLPLSF